MQGYDIHFGALHTQNYTSETSGDILYEMIKKNFDQGKIVKLIVFHGEMLIFSQFSNELCDTLLNNEMGSLLFFWKAMLWSLNNP